MSKNKNDKLGTVLMGIGSTSAMDKSGERVLLEGIDISTLALDGVANTEHKNDTLSQIVGKIVEAKKIFKESDCENEHHRYFFKKAGMPYLFIKIILFDLMGHQSAQDLVAMLKFDKAMEREGEVRPVIGFSIEGSKLEVKDGIVKKCIARKIAITNHPCNSTCLAEIVEEEEAPKDSLSLTDFKKIFKKSEEIEKSENLNKAIIPPSNRIKTLTAEQHEQRQKKQDEFNTGMKQAKIQQQNAPHPIESEKQQTGTAKLISGEAWKQKIERIRQQNQVNKPPKPEAMKQKDKKPEETQQQSKFLKMNGVRKNIIEKENLKKNMVKSLKLEAIELLNKNENRDEIIKSIEDKGISKSEAMTIASLYLLQKEKEKEEKMAGLI